MKIEHDEVCTSCKGTGLFSGMAERGGFAVVCHRCKGTGAFRFIHEWEPFSKRERGKSEIEIVLRTNPGIMVGGPSKTAFGGMAAMKWALLDNPEEFPPKTEMRNYTCPAWWYQSADYRRKPKWDECNNTWGSPFSRCPFFKTKDKCWIRFDEEGL